MWEGAHGRRERTTYSKDSGVMLGALRRRKRREECRSPEERRKLKYGERSSRDDHRVQGSEMAWVSISEGDLIQNFMRDAW